MATQEEEFISADGFSPEEAEEEYEGYEDQSPYPPDDTPMPSFNLTADAVEGEDDRRAMERAAETAAAQIANENEGANKEFENQAVKFAQNKAKQAVKEIEEQACQRLAEKYNLHLRHMKSY